MTTVPRTIPQVLDRIADQFSDHDALVTDDRRLTFAELRDEVRRAAAAMIDLGVNSGDRVAIWSPNTWHWVVACLATTYAGGVLVPLNTPIPPAKPLTSWRAPAHRCCSRPASSSARTRPLRSTATPCQNCGTSSGCRSRRTTEPGTSSWAAAPIWPGLTRARPR